MMKKTLLKAMDGLAIGLVGYKVAMPYSAVVGITLLAVASVLLGQALGEE